MFSQELFLYHSGMDPDLVLTAGQKTLRFRKRLKKVAKLKKACVENTTTEALEDTSKNHNQSLAEILLSTTSNKGVKNTLKHFQ